MFRPSCCSCVCVCVEFMLTEHQYVQTLMLLVCVCVWRRHPMPHCESRGLWGCLSVLFVWVVCRLIILCSCLELFVICAALLISHLNNASDLSQFPHTPPHMSSDHRSGEKRRRLRAFRKALQSFIIHSAVLLARRAWCAFCSCINVYLHVTFSDFQSEVNILLLLLRFYWNILYSPSSWLCMYCQPAYGCPLY